MRRVDRAAAVPPASLSDPEGKGKKELELTRASYQAAVAAADLKWSYEFAAYSGHDVKLALEQLFHGKCAYCESRYAAQAPVDVEHYRPKGQVDGEEHHPGYWWLAMEWSNLLPSCIDCNRRRWQNLPAMPNGLEDLHNGILSKERTAKLGKQDQFPILGDRVVLEGGDLVEERALLLEPTLDNPLDHLEYYLDAERPIALIIPKRIDGERSPKALASIQVYGLNRLGLVQERTRVLQHLIFLGHIVEEVDDMAHELRAVDPDDKMASRLELLSEKIMDEIGRMGGDDQPYCTLVKEWLAQL